METQSRKSLIRRNTRIGWIEDGREDASGLSFASCGMGKALREHSGWTWGKHDIDNADVPKAFEDDLYWERTANGREDFRRSRMEMGKHRFIEIYSG